MRKRRSEMEEECPEEASGYDGEDHSNFGSDVNPIELTLKKGYYVVKSDRSIVCNPKTRNPLKLNTRAAAVTMSELIGCSSVLIVSNDGFVWEQ